MKKLAAFLFAVGIIASTAGIAEARHHHHDGFWGGNRGYYGNNWNNGFQRRVYRNEMRRVYGNPWRNNYGYNNGWGRSHRRWW